MKASAFFAGRSFHQERQPIAVVSPQDARHFIAKQRITAAYKDTFGTLPPNDINVDELAQRLLVEEGISL